MFKAAAGGLIDPVNQETYYLAWDSRRFRTWVWDKFVATGKLELLWLWSERCEDDAVAFPDELRIPEEPLPF